MLGSVSRPIQEEDREGKRIIFFPWNFLKNSLFKSKGIEEILSEFSFGIAVGRWFESAILLYQSHLPFSLWISNSVLDSKRAFLENSKFPLKLGRVIYKRVLVYENKIMKAAKFIWVTSDTSKKNFLNWYKDFNKKIRHLRIPFDDKQNIFLSDNSKSERRILFFGRPELSVLNFLGFLRVFKNIKLTAGTEDILLEVLGEEPKSIFFRFALRGMELDKDITFTKINHTDDIDKSFQSSWVYVEPSDFDLMGIGFLKAVSFGIPVVSCFGSISGEVVTDGEHGLLVPTRDYESLNSALSQLIFNDRVRDDCRNFAYEALKEEFSKKFFDSELELLQNH